LTIRQRRCADSIRLNAMASAAASAPPQMPVSPVSTTVNERACCGEGVVFCCACRVTFAGYRVTSVGSLAGG
jgi:hypothetical protein